MSLVEAALFHDPMVAQLARGRLESAGIEAVLFDLQMSWVGNIIPIRLMVAEEDRAEALKLLREAEAGGAD